MDLLEIWLSRLSRLNSVALEACVAELGITASESAVLATLVRTGEVLSPTRLQGLVIQSPGGLTKTLRRLESAGLVRRRTDPADRRALLVEITAKGRKLSERADVAVAEHYRAVLDGADRSEATAVIRRLLDGLEAVTGMPSSQSIGVSTPTS